MYLVRMMSDSNICISLLYLFVMPLPSASLLSLCTLSVTLSSTFMRQMAKEQPNPWPCHLSVLSAAAAPAERSCSPMLSDDVWEIDTRGPENTQLWWDDRRWDMGLSHMLTHTRSSHAAQDSRRVDMIRDIFPSMQQKTALSKRENTWGQQQ